MCDRYEQVVELAERIQAGDGDAWFELNDLLRPWMLKIAQGVLKDHHQAEDVVQESLLIVARQLNSGVDVTTSFSSYILTVLKHESARLVRRQNAKKRRPERGVLQDSQLVSSGDGRPLSIANLAIDPLSDSLDVSDLEVALLMLPDDQRSVLRRRYWDNATRREIAEQDGIHASSVFRLEQAALARLRQIYLDEERDLEDGR